MGRSRMPATMNDAAASGITPASQETARRRSGRRCATSRLKHMPPKAAPAPLRPETEATRVRKTGRRGGVRMLADHTE